MHFFTVRAPIHHGGKGNLQYSQGPKVITQPVQGPPVALTQISSLTGVTGQKITNHPAPSQTHTISRHGNSQNNTTVNTVSRISVTGSSIPMARVIPQIVNAQSVGSPTVVHGNNVLDTVVGPLYAARTSNNVIATAVGAVSHCGNSSNTTAVDHGPPHGHSTAIYRTSSQTGIVTTTINATSLTTSSGPAERVGPAVTQYNITTPYYEPSNQNSYPQSGNIVSHTLSSSNFVSGGATLRVSSATVVTPGVPGVTSTAETASQSVPVKPNASPRPSILRKRPDTDCAPLKAAKNLTPALSISTASPPSPKRPDSRGNGNASSGSTTISANSSPGLQIEECDNGAGIVTVSRNIGVRTPPTAIKQEPPDDPVTGLRHYGSSAIENSHLSNGTSLTGINIPQLHIPGQPQIISEVLSPRKKKPRKQQL